MNIARVIKNDRDKQRLAREHGITLLSIDPSSDANTFAYRMNKLVVPVLRAAGYRAVPWFREEAKAKRMRAVMRRMMK
jgi:hypothetical protein